MNKTDELFDAINRRDAVAVRALLAGDAALARARSPQGVSALMLARYHNLREVTDTLLALHSEVDIFEAATFGKVERLAALLAADPARARARSADGGTALHFASFFAQPDAARLLVAQGADVRAVAPAFGNVQPLHSAAAGRSAAIVRLLLEAGADPNARQNQGWTALHSAAQHGNAEMVRVLLQHS